MNVKSWAAAPSSKYPEGDALDVCGTVGVGIGDGWLIRALDNSIKAVDVVGGVRHPADGAVGLGQAVHSRHHAVLQPLLDVFNVASLRKFKTEVVKNSTWPANEMNWVEA